MPLTHPLSLGSKISHPFSRISYFTTTSFITPLSGYRALTSPLHSKIPASILSLIIYQLFEHFTCNYLRQLIMESSYLLIGIPFTSIKTPTEWAYLLNNSPDFTPTLKFTWIIFNALMYLLRTQHPHSKGLLLNEISLDYAGCKDHKPCIPHILSIIHPSLDTKLNQLSKSDMILYPMFSAK